MGAGASTDGEDAALGGDGIGKGEADGGTGASFAGSIFSKSEMKQLGAYFSSVDTNKHGMVPLDVLCSAPQVAFNPLFEAVVAGAVRMRMRAEHRPRRGAAETVQDSDGYYRFDETFEAGPLGLEMGAVAGGEHGAHVVGMVPGGAAESRGTLKTGDRLIAVGATQGLGAPKDLIDMPTEQVMQIIGEHTRPMVLTFRRPKSVPLAGNEEPGGVGSRAAQPFFEVDHTAPTTLQDFVAALAVFSVKASDDAKRTALFSVFDREGTGTVKESDLRRVMLQCCNIRGVSPEDELVDTLVSGTYERTKGEAEPTFTRARFDQLMAPDVLDRAMTIVL